MDRNPLWHQYVGPLFRSLSARRAWIEIIVSVYVLLCRDRSLSARRAWIEISSLVLVGSSFSVALRKESVDRNFGGSTAYCAVGRSLSARRAWIEISRTGTRWAKLLWSLSARRAWIEINNRRQCSRAWSVALRKESVDRNNMVVLVLSLISLVALRKESVDRNTESPLKDNATDVALRKESVDRNPSNSS